MDAPPNVLVANSGSIVPRLVSHVAHGAIAGAEILNHVANVEAQRAAARAAEAPPKPKAKAKQKKAKPAKGKTQRKRR